MESTSGVMLRILMNRFHNTPSEHLLRYLPQDYTNACRAVDSAVTDPAPGLQKPVDLLPQIHYSWLLPFMSQYSPALRNAVLQAVEPRQRDKLRKLISLPRQTEEGTSLAPPVRALLINKLYAQVRPAGLLPQAFLPETPLSFLAQQSKEQLVEIIEFLGLYDLAEGIRHVIDKNFLQKVYHCLTHKQKQFLRICLHQQEKVVAPKMEMSLWNGDSKKLFLMIQRRGLLRLGKALCGQHSDFVWYVAHILDSGRGTILLQHFSHDSKPVITARLTQQIVNLMNFLNPKSAS